MTARGLVVVLVAAAHLSGCVMHERYRYVQPQDECFSPKDPFPDGTPRPFPSLDCRDAGYQVGFVEFDQQGQLIEPKQQDKALALITAGRTTPTRPGPAPSLRTSSGFAARCGR
jgi:hypothetical protein